jgi:pyridoxine kinase
MNILSIQSHVAYGHVGNASAVFPMQRLGVEVWAIHTVQFSNHTGYGAWKGRVFDGPAIEELVEGIAERGVLPRCDGVLSGYMGSADIGTAILAAVARVRAANPDALYCCDPVIGDIGRGVFVRPGIPEFMRDRAVPAADIITPNQFELDWLAGAETRTLADVKAAAASVHGLGPKVVLVTSVHTDETPATPSTSWPGRAAGSGACARRSCRSASTGRATPSRPCSSSTTPAPARPRRPSPKRPLPSTASSSARRTPAPGRS